MADKEIKTKGGTYVGDDVNTNGGNFTGRDHILKETILSGHPIVAVAALLVVGLIVIAIIIGFINVISIIKPDFKSVSNPQENPVAQLTVAKIAGLTASPVNRQMTVTPIPPTNTSVSKSALTATIIPTPKTASTLVAMPKMQTATITSTAPPSLSAGNGQLEAVAKDIQYKIVEVTAQKDEVTFWVVAQNDSENKQSWICATACRLFDTDGNLYTASSITINTEKLGSNASVNIPSHAPFRFGLSFPAPSSKKQFAKLEIPVTDGLLEFLNIPAPYPVANSSAAPSPTVGSIQFEGMVKDIQYKIVEVTAQKDEVTFWVVAQNTSENVQSWICATACRLFDTDGNLYTASSITINTEKLGSNASVNIPSHAPFRFGVSFPVPSSKKQFAKLEIPVTDGLLEFLNIPALYNVNSQ